MGRLDILKSSLVKKEAKFDSKFSAHMTDIKLANGQPLNDKRNGQVTLNRWENQNDSLRNIQKEIKKTKDAIEKEECIQRGVEKTKGELPEQLILLIEQGIINQWRKYPTFFFVTNGGGARIIWMENKKTIGFKHLDKCNSEERKIFAQVYNELKKQLAY